MEGGTFRFTAHLGSMIGVEDKYKIDSSFLVAKVSLLLQQEALLALYTLVGIVPSVEVDTRRVAVLLLSEVLR